MADRMGSGARYYASTGYSSVMRRFYRDVCFNIGSLTGYYYVRPATLMRHFMQDHLILPLPRV